MIDTQEKLDAFVKEHRIRMIAEAGMAFARYAEGNGDDVWNAFMAGEAHDIELCDYNVYRPDECNLIRIVAYALKRDEHDKNYAPYGLIVNTKIECHVADITWEE